MIVAGSSSLISMRGFGVEKSKPGVEVVGLMSAGDNGLSLGGVEVT